MASIIFPCLLFMVLAISLAFSEPVQYCRAGLATTTIGFCLGITSHHNRTSNSHDLYLSLNVPRPSHLGWTAVGTGSMMAGSLMLIVYGDPDSSHEPVLSIRTVEGHAQPRLITRADMGAADIRVLQAEWIAPHETSGVTGVRQAKLAVVCFSCTLFPGTSISATTSSQPWIWAWNNKQEMSVYSFDADLQMHAHHAGNGGWGRFYVDMSRSVSEAVRRPSLPPLRKDLAMLGTSDSPIGLSGFMDAVKAKPMVAAHGAAMCIAFLVLFPAGVAAIRSGSKSSFAWHSCIQLGGIVLAATGMTTGLILSRWRLSTAHQWVGVGLVPLLMLQGVFGWCHHVMYLRTKRRSWASYTHIWIGRLGLLIAWSNVVGGMMLSGQSRSLVSVTISFVVVEALGLLIWVWRATRR